MSFALKSACYLAGKEVAANLRNWWIAIMGLLCAALSWTVGSYGFSFASGELGQDTVLVSLIHLQLYIVPLLGLLLAYDAILGECESGMFDLHLALGIGCSSFLVGKWAGVAVSLWIALLPSLVLQAVAFVRAGGEPIAFAALMFYCGLLCGAVVSVGLFASSASRNRGTVVSLCIGAWLVLAVLIDFAVVSLLAITQGDVPDWLVNGLIVGNPLGAYRLLSYLHFFPEQLENLVHIREAGWLPAALVLAVWTIGPLAATAHRLVRLYRPIDVVAVAAVAILIGCGNPPDDAEPMPAAIKPGQACAIDGMLLEAHEGPKGQLLRTDGSRAFFCDAKEVFEEWLDPVRQRKVVGVWFQALDRANGEGWMAPDSLYFVAGSDKMSAMGPMLAPFCEAASAEEFVAAHGGRIIRFEEVAAPLLDALRRQGMDHLR